MWQEMEVAVNQQPPRNRIQSVMAPAWAWKPGLPQSILEMRLCPPAGAQSEHSAKLSPNP